MKKLILGLISALFLISTTAQAVIFSRQLWRHPNGKVVELFSDIHKSRFYPKYSKLLERLDTIRDVKKQQQDIIAYAKKFGKKIHIFIEDRDSLFLKNKLSLDRNCLHKLLIICEKHPDEFDTLAFLSYFCTVHNLSNDNIDCRIKNKSGTHCYIDKKLLTTINKYNDGKLLNDLYKKLKDPNDESQIGTMDVWVIHSMYEYTHNKNPKFIPKNRLLICAGGAHVNNYSQALSLMGYRRIDSQTKLHPKAQDIPTKLSLLGKALRCMKNYLGLPVYECLELPNNIKIPLTLENALHLITHPLDIAQIATKVPAKPILLPVQAPKRRQLQATQRRPSAPKQPHLASSKVQPRTAPARQASARFPKSTAAPSSTVSPPNRIPSVMAKPSARAVRQTSHAQSPKSVAVRARKIPTPQTRRTPVQAPSVRAPRSTTQVPSATPWLKGVK